MSRIGIFAGTFDPVHRGHIAFAQAAATQAQLDTVVLLPERTPRHKTNASSFGHRVHMLQLAAKRHQNLHVLTLGDDQFTVAGTLPQLQQHYRNDQLVLLMGSDVARRLSAWQDLPLLAATAEIVVGLRAGESRQDLHDTLHAIGLPLRVQFAQNASHAQVCATDVRRGSLHLTEPTVRDYITQNQLYSAAV